MLVLKLFWMSMPMSGTEQTIESLVTVMERYTNLQCPTCPQTRVQ